MIGPTIRLATGIVSAALLCAVMVTVVLLVSVAHFLFIVDAGERYPGGHADAIVVLSGDPFRVEQAFALLAAGHGHRLFLAGVDNADEIARQKAIYPSLYTCCVEVEHESMTTHEDAAAIAGWAKQRHVSSLLVVTSIAHLPRALVEIHDALPGVPTVASGVTKGLTDFTAWRTDPVLWRSLAREYVKTVGALLLDRFPRLRGLLAEGDDARSGPID